ncbi:MAG: Rpn family recombination-promoting nuclease/putative transposase [Lachnospiraceae bacterium]|nr:Rpn family recombination-promoting nuclease/putative transposase [Lachnospiraceae bacterium]
MKENEKLNMQMSERNALLEPLQKLNLMDDFLFDVTTVNLEACQIIIELSLNIRIKKIRWKEGQKVVHNLPGRRGIRMDFYVEDTEGRIFDVEMQKRNRGNIPKRTRYYQGLLDAPLLKSGEEGFDNLKPTYIVVICGFDQYKKGKYRYTFCNLCKEVSGLELGDECTKIILNTKGKNDDEVEPALVDFLHYVENSDREEMSENCDERLLRLHAIVKKIKTSEQMGVSYMKMEERDRQIREDGKKEGIEAGREEGERNKILSLIQKKLDKGQTIEEIADALEEAPAVIKGLMKELEEK